ncbi:class I SAM-dependent methyltransferase [Haliangium sp.]|uniref:class I SAM-dependent methyltransferase n=1 Tax=Haliangium sp. TaxID=2663208 RepID=UPI003D10351C
MRRSRNTEQIVRVRDVFDEWAQDGRADGMERGHSRAARHAFELLELAPGQRFLDIGSGNGYAVRWAAQVAPSVEALGIDLSAQMVTLARTMTAGLPNARFRRGGFPMSALPQAYFDAIFSMEVFYYLPDLAASLRAVRELLVPGGRFACVVEFYRENAASHDWPRQLGVVMHLLSAEEWGAACLEAGLEVVRQEQLPPDRAGEAGSGRSGSAGSLITLAQRPA